jgi:outer membrane receptor for ferrienterochelin and colicin
MSFSKFDNLHFYAIDYSGANQIYNRFNVLYDGASLLNVNGQIKYQLNEKINLFAKGNYYLYKTENLARPYHKPEFDMTLSGIYNLKSKIILRADLFVMGAQWALTQTGSDGDYMLQPKQLNGWADINFEAEYRYTKMLSFFARLNNIASQRYYRWERYPSQRFNFMVGLSFVPF